MFRFIKSKFYIQVPALLPWAERETWHQQAKSARPFAYFLSQSIPSKIQEVGEWIAIQYGSFRSLIRNYIFDRLHMINTGLKPGYHEVETRMLHGMFSLLVDHVEVELSWMHVVFDLAKIKDMPWWSKGLTRFKRVRCPENGLKYLRAEMLLDDPVTPVYDQNPMQAKIAREVWELYHWWTSIRPRRPDPHDISGWTEYCATHPVTIMFSPNRDPEDQKRSMEIIDETNRIEEAYHAEDEAMLIRLIKIRRYLWT